jgi:hypothetical protein
VKIRNLIDSLVDMRVRLARAVIEQKSLTSLLSDLDRMKRVHDEEFQRRLEPTRVVRDVDVGVLRHDNRSRVHERRPSVREKVNKVLPLPTDYRYESVSKKGQSWDRAIL